MKQAAMAFILPELDYDYSELEPFFDAGTMKIHHENHHGSYVDKLNDFIEKTDFEDLTIFEMFVKMSQLPNEVRNFGGGFYNHNMFWKILSPEKQKINDEELEDQIIKYFGSVEEFKNNFKEVSLKHFGSGWTWLLRKENGELVITSTNNQDNPLMDLAPVNGFPLLCLDLWEHAYYLNYKNNRGSYVDAFWNVVNWKKVAEYYQSSKSFKNKQAVNFNEYISKG